MRRSTNEKKRKKKNREEKKDKSFLINCNLVVEPGDGCSVSAMEKGLDIGGVSCYAKRGKTP